ncbi:hypothetical protein NXY56_004363 [Leishmania guyanensis]
MGDVECGPLLSSSRENPLPSLRQLSSSSPQRQLRQLNTTWALAATDENGTPAPTLADGTSSDARCSFFSNFSLSARSEATASRSHASQSPMVAALLRPFQCLQMWCRGCCRCFGIRDSWLTSVGFAVVDVDDSVPVMNVSGDALPDSGVSRGSWRNRDRGNAPPVATPHNGSGQGHLHRQYLPPRSRSSEVGFGGRTSPSTPLTEHVYVVREGANMPPSDSLDEISVADSSTSPSSLSFTQRPRDWGEGEGGQLVMRRGVLMRMAADGTCTCVSGMPGYSSGCRHPGPSVNLSGRTNDSHVLQFGLMEPSTDEHSNADSSPIAREGEDASGLYAVTTALNALEASRQPLRTLEQISAALTACAPYLPLRVEVEPDLSSTMLIPTVDTEATPAKADLASKQPATISTSPAVPLDVHILGPLLPCRTPQALRTLEDILLEDCEGSRLPFCALHCADLDLRRVRVGEDSDYAPPTIAASVQRAPSDPSLDLLVSPTTEAYSSCTAIVSQVLDFLKHLVAARAAQLTTLHFTRCYVVPHDLGQSIPLPLATVRRLRFEHCSLTPAHVGALLELARQQDALASSKLAEACGVIGLSSHRSRSFGALEELQLSGSLTSECIAELLDYVEEQQQYRKADGEAIALRALCVPSSVVRTTRTHPFVQANGSRISVWSVCV